MLQPYPEAIEPIRTSYTSVMNRHSEEIHQLRWILLCILEESFPSGYDDSYIERRLKIAGATDEEIKTLCGT